MHRSSLTRLDPAESHVNEHVGACPAHTSTAVDEQGSLLVAGRLVHLPAELQEGRGRGRSSEGGPGEILKVCHCPRLVRLWVEELELGNEILETWE